MRFGFVIDNRRCIGCHACSTACKSENEVPVGVSRTWVKYTETGRYPDVTRHFQVTRCNHCENPPCVRICPVTAMYQRDDGIVEFDPEVCIGCKACIQACPYDAIYIDPNSGTAAKCHYCAHRVDLGLEPACVVVCPEHAILAGDLDDPQSEIARTLARADVTVRKPEQGTAPKLYYIEGHAASMHPTATPGGAATFMFTDPLDHAAASPSEQREREPAQRRASSGAAIKTPDHQGAPSAGPLQMGGRSAEHMIQVGYNAQHRLYWHWQVPAYIVTKDIATGIMLLLTALVAGFWASSTSILEASSPMPLVASSVALFFTLVTTALLVSDLERPERFLRILLRPQWRSWLTRGSYLLVAFSTLLGLLWLLELGAQLGWLAPATVADGRTLLLWIALPISLATSVYTAFLFGQAEGRDLWQHPLLPVQLLVRSVLAGAAVLWALGEIAGFAEGVTATLKLITALSLIVDLGITLLGELTMPHSSEVAAQAARHMTRGRYRHHYWIGYVALGRLLPLLLLLAPLPSALIATAAAAMSLIGLFLVEYAFVMAPQRVPNS